MRGRPLAQNPPDIAYHTLTRERLQLVLVLGTQSSSSAELTQVPYEKIREGVGMQSRLRQ